MECRALSEDYSSRDGDHQPISVLIAHSADTTIELLLEDANAIDVLAFLEDGSVNRMVHLHVVQHAPLCTRFKIQSCALDRAQPVEWGSIGLRDMMFNKVPKFAKAPATASRSPPPPPSPPLQRYNN